MDIMRPKLTRIGNMCFRRLDIPDDGIIDDYNNFIDNVPQMTTEDNNTNDKKEVDIESSESKLKSIDVLEALIDSDEDIEDKSDGKGIRFGVELKIGKYFHKFIVGEKGENRKRIENSTRTRIVVPNHTDLTSPVVITGNNKQDVKSARAQIETIVRRWRQTADFTHFVSIPFNLNPIRERFVNFKNQILNDIELKTGIDEQFFQSSAKLHLTICPLLLTDDNERNIASKVLEDCLNNDLNSILNGQKIRLKVKGIDYMNDDPSQVDVLYAKVVDMSDNQCFQSVVDQLFDRFKESGLMSGRSHQFENISDGIKVKIHLTLMNTKFKVSDGYNRRGDRRGPRREPFDATNILKRLGDYDFGETNVETIEISIRHSSKGKDGYYSHTNRIEI